jgi:hypothetical protein
VQLAAWHAKKTWITISDDEVLNAYTKLTGWTKVAAHDPGMDVVTGLNFAIQTGFAGHKLGGFCRSIYVPGDGRWGIDKHAVARIGLARLLCGFGGAALAIDSPYKAYINPDGPWLAADLDARIEGSHCIPIIGYDSSWIYCITWGQVVKMDWAFLASTSKELYFAYAQDWLTENGSADLHFSGPEMIDTLRYYEVSEYLTVMP